MFLKKREVNIQKKPGFFDFFMFKNKIIPL